MLRSSCVLVLCAMVDAPASGQALAQSVTARDVLALPPEQQRTVVHDGLKRRADDLSNVSAEVHVETYTARYANGNVGERIETETGTRVDQTILRIGDSYRFDRTYYMGDATTPLYESKSGYDAATGASRMWGAHSQLKEPTARIALEKDPITRDNWYNFVLAGRLDDFRPSFIQHVLDHADKTSVTADPADDAQLIVTVAQTHPDKARDVRKYWTSPEKGFLITRVEHRWERREKDGSLAYDHRDWLVQETRDVGGLLLPSKLRLVGRSQHRPSICGIYEIEARALKIGELTEADLFVDFPPGTEVNDMIQQKIYHVGHEDQARTYTEGEVLFDEDSTPEAAPRYRWLVIGNVALVAVVALALAVRYFIRR